MTIFLATFIASLLDPIAIALCIIAGATLRRYFLSALAGAVIFVALLALLSTVPKVIPILAGRIAAGALLASVGCFLGKKIWPRRQAA